MGIQESGAGALLDELDQRILGALHIAPRASWGDLASVLAVDPGTLTRRFARLEDERIVRVIGQFRSWLHSTVMPVHVYLDIEGHTPLTVIDRLRALPAMQNLAQLSGGYPVYATMHAPSEAATSTALDQLFAMPGVRGVKALPTLRTVRRGAAWDPQTVAPAEREQLMALTAAAPDDAAVDERPDKPPTAQERALIAALMHDGRASAASLGRAVELPTSTTHRLVRKILDEGWVTPRVEVQYEQLGFFCNFHLRLRARPGSTAAVLRRLAEMAPLRLAAHVAGDMSILCTGIVVDRAALADFLDQEVAAIPDVDVAAVDVILAERRRYWLDRDPVRGLGDFTPPAPL